MGRKSESEDDITMNVTVEDLALIEHALVECWRYMESEEVQTYFTRRQIEDMKVLRDALREYFLNDFRASYQGSLGVGTITMPVLK